MNAVDFVNESVAFDGKEKVRGFIKSQVNKLLKEAVSKNISEKEITQLLEEENVPDLNL